MHQPTVYVSHAGFVASCAKKVASSGRPTVCIKLDNHNEKTVYTTGSAISGVATLTTQANIEFDDVQITLEGQCRVTLEQMSQISGHSTTEGVHTFLKLNMPISPSSLPASRVLEAGASLSIPFNFVVPNELLPQACTHECVQDHVHQAHLQMPPSMGTTRIMDVVPDMARVHYYISVRTLQLNPSKMKYVLLGQVNRMLFVIPRTPEQPPLRITKDMTDYQLVRTKSLKRGVFKGKYGEVTFSASQPKPFFVSPDSSLRPQTTMNVTLNFDPASPNCKPPKIGTLTTKIRSATFASIRNQTDLAKKMQLTMSFDPSRGYFQSTKTLSNMTISTDAMWKFGSSAPAYTRRDSGYSTSTSTTNATESQDDTTTKPGSYTASILVPLTLPSGTDWKPTFHSCLISRLYLLELSVTIHGPSAIPTRLTLRVPVQIACNGDPGTSPTPDLLLPGFSEVDDIFRPRLLSIPNVEFVRTSLSQRANSVPEMPPGYAGGYENYVRRESLRA